VESCRDPPSQFLLSVSDRIRRVSHRVVLCHDYNNIDDHGVCRRWTNQGTKRARQLLCDALRRAMLSDGDVPEAVLTEARELKVKGSPSTAAQGLRELVLTLQGGVREL
jgi:hypothetical protein